MTFQLDTSGAVPLVGSYPELGRDMVRWEDLSPFEQGYIEGLLRSLADDYGDRLKVWTGAHHRWTGFSDLHHSALALILRDCEGYEASGRVVGLWRGDADQGAHFWRWRSQAADEFFPVLTPTLGGDGKVYLREGGQ